MRVRIARLLSAVILLAAVAFLSSACATSGTAERDTGIQSSIRNSYAFRTYLQDSNISVSSESGVVTLSGTAPDASQRFLAEDIARGVPGVRSVDNRIEVEGGIPQEGSDAWLGAQVKAELMMHPEANAAGTDVYVENGVVTLRGQAKSPAQRSLATEYAKNVEGVKSVVNEMTLPGAAGGEQMLGQEVNDRSITAQANTALDTNRVTSELDPNIVTNGGIVTVHGVADNLAQKDMVTRIIADIRGVRGVNNRMTVR